MNQVKSDLRFVLWALVAVVLLAPVQVWLELREFQSFEVRESLGMAGSAWVWMLMMMISVVALILVVQKDLPAGSKEFWLSRPFSRKGMVGSKIVVFFVFLGLLGVASLTAPLLGGGGEQWREFVMSFVMRSAWILGVAVVLASISSSLPQVLQNGLLVGGLVLVGGIAWARVLEFELYSRSSELRAAATLAAWVVFLIGAVALVARMYLRKSMERGVLWLVALLLVCAGIFQFWPISLSGDKMSVAEQKVEGWDRINLQLELREEDIQKFRRNGSQGSVNGVTTRQIPISGLLENLPMGYSVRDIFFSGRFEVDDETSWRVPWGFSRAQTFLPNDELQDYQDIELFQSPVYGPYEDKDSLRLKYLSLGSIPVRELKKWKGRSISYQGEAQVQAVKTSRLGRFRFGEDTLLDAPGARIKATFEGEDVIPDILRLDGKAWYPKPIFTGLDYQGIRVFLVNEEKKEFVELRSRDGGSSPIGRSSTWEQNFELTGNRWNRVFRERLDRKEWMGESFFYLYAPIPQGEFVVPVEMKGFRLEDVMGPFD